MKRFLLFAGMLFLLTGSINLSEPEKKELMHVQLDIYASAQDLDAARFPLRNAWFAGANVDDIERKQAPELGQARFMLRPDGFGFLPFVCYEKFHKCIRLEKNPAIINQGIYG